MRSLQEIFTAQPETEILIIGDDGVSYGSRPSDGKTWKEVFTKEISPKLSEEHRSRIHFLGRLPYEQYVAIMQVSTVHVYLTYPFVLSWSLLEAMSIGCSIVASDTAPLHEVITDDVTGKLVDFFSHKELASSVVDLLKNPQKRIELGSAARRYAKENYDLNNICLPKQIRWVEELGKIRE